MAAPALIRSHGLQEPFVTLHTTYAWRHGPGARQDRSTKNAPSGANPAPARRLTPEDGDSGAAVEKCLLRLRLQTATATGAQEERTDDDHQSPRASRTQESE
jgi:hypothetical protein